MKKPFFVCCATLDGVCALLCNYQGSINENGEKNFYVLFFYCIAERKYIPLFSKSQPGFISFAK